MRKILVLRFSSIGDIVLTTPILRCIHEQLKDSEIHYLTKKNFASIVEINPYVSKVFAIEKNVKEVLPLLKKEQYDFIVDLHHNIRTKQVVWALGKPYKSFPKLNIKKWLLVHLKVNKLPVQHIVDRYFEAVHPLHVSNDTKGLEFYISDPNHIDVKKELPPAYSNGYVAVVIGAQHYTKRMPNEKIIALCNKLTLPVVLIGGKEDYNNATEIHQKAVTICFNACGKFNLFQSASIIKQAQLVITHDTGMMHIAAAFNKKIISVWGNTVPEFGMYPYMPLQQHHSIISEVKNLECRPCSKIGKTSCPKGHFKCMNDISVDEIIVKSLEMLS